MDSSTPKKKRGIASQATGEERTIEVLNEELMEQVLEAENLRSALKAVRANKGAAGVDGISTEELEGHLSSVW